MVSLDVQLDNFTTHIATDGLDSCVCCFLNRPNQHSVTIFEGSPQKGGRKGTSKYDPERYDGLASVMARFGAVDTEIAEQFGISRRLFYVWRKEHPSLREALRAGKFEFDSEKIEQTLCKRATGYYFTETTKGLGKPDPETGEQKLIVTKTVRKHTAADVTAIIFWLRNRRKADWSDKQQSNVPGLESLAEAIRKGRERAALRASS
ncbi:MAG: hypothetical protein WAN11_26260 [Syntrophobacteraceae bacterium]